MLQFWGKVVLTATFLINRIPSPQLNNDSTYFKLYNKELDYSLLNFFGFLCYVSTHKQLRTKFDPRAEACAFICYPSHIKGYKLYHLKTHKVLISIDVHFLEHIFSFSKASHDNISFFSPSFIYDEDFSFLYTPSTNTHDINSPIFHLILYMIMT